MTRARRILNEIEPSDYDRKFGKGLGFAIPDDWDLNIPRNYVTCNDCDKTVELKTGESPYKQFPLWPTERCTDCIDADKSDPYHDPDHDHSSYLWYLFVNGPAGEVWYERGYDCPNPDCWIPNSIAFSGDYDEMMVNLREWQRYFNELRRREEQREYD